MKRCSIPGCERKHEAFGVCQKHYDRWVEHNNFFYEPPFKKENGEGTITAGYHIITENGKTKRRHHQIAENALGRPIEYPHVVHHVNGNRSDNRNENLVICEDRKYHRMLHNRANAIANGYPAHYRKCGFCHDYDELKNLFLCGRSYRHLSCASIYRKKRYLMLKK